MAIRFAAFEATQLPALRRFGERLCDEQVWNRPRGEAFYRWRYLEAPGYHTCLALRDDECLAVIGAFERTYRFGTEERLCLELCDWACLPARSAGGLGIQVLRRLMQEGTPIVAVDGTEDTVELLPRLGFRRFASLALCGLPLSSVLVESVLAKYPRPAAALGRLAFAAGPRLWFRPRRRCVPGGGRVLPAASVGAEIEALYQGDTRYETLPLLPRERLAWLANGFPGAGHFLPLYFAVGERLVGWALLRIFDNAGCCEATLVEVFAPQPDLALYTWVVSEASVRAAGLGAGLVRAATTCPTLAAALRANRFLSRTQAPVLLWSKEELEPPGPVHIGLDNGDSPLLPYAARWSWPDEPAPGAAER